MDRDRWTAKQDWFYRTPTTKLEVQSSFSGIRGWNLDIINTRKRNTINIVQYLKSSKQWSLAKLGKITFTLFECHRSIDKSIDFHFLLLSWKNSLE